MTQLRTEIHFNFWQRICALKHLLPQRLKLEVPSPGRSHDFVHIWILLLRVSFPHLTPTSRCKREPVQTCVLQAQGQAAKARAGPHRIPRVDVQGPWGLRAGGLVMNVIRALFLTTGFLSALGRGRGIGGETPQQNSRSPWFHHESAASAGNLICKMGTGFLRVLQNSKVPPLESILVSTHWFPLAVCAFLCPRRLFQTLQELVDKEQLHTPQGRSPHAILSCPQGPPGGSAPPSPVLTCSPSALCSRPPQPCFLLLLPCFLGSPPKYTMCTEFPVSALVSGEAQTKTCSHGEIELLCERAQRSAGTEAGA